MAASAHPPAGLPLRTGALLLVSAAIAGAAFERAPFADPLPSPGRLGANPAGLARATAAVCGHFLQDRPFGLRELAGHHLLVAAPAAGRVRAGLGLAARGPARHREQAVLAAAGASVARRLDLGAGLLAVQLTRTGRPVRRAWAPVAGGRAGGVRGWQLEGWWHGGGGSLLEPRGSLRLRHESAEASLALGVRWRGPDARAEVRLTLPLRKGARMTVDGLDRPRQYGLGLEAGVRSLRVGARLRSHHQLGVTPSWILGRACR